MVLGGCRAARVRPEPTGPAPRLWGGHGAQVWATPTKPPGTLQASVPRPRQAPRRRRNWRPGVSAQKEEAEPTWAEDILGAVQTGALTAGPRPPGPAPGCVAAAAKPAGGGEAHRPSPLPSGILTRAALRAFYVGRSLCDPGGFEGPEWALETRSSTKTWGEGTDAHTGGLQVWAGGQRLPLNPHQAPGRWHHTPNIILAGF